MRWLVLLTFIVSTLYVQRRGKVRYPAMRQLSDHSTLMAPINCFAYLFSKVPVTPYLDPVLIPELKLLRDEWQTIRDEALRLRAANRIKTSDGYNDIGFNSFFRNKWKRFYLKWYDDAHPSAQRWCPRTTALLQQIPAVKAAMFAELGAGSQLMPHRDPCAACLRYHLGLVTPNSLDCVISVDGVDYAWRDGEDVLFDETYIHTAANHTEMDRIILFCDIERPMRFRWAQLILNSVSHVLMRAAASPNETGDRTGGLNRVFKYLYAVRLVGKRIKASNRSVYYVIKWLIFASLAVGFFFLL